MRLSYVRWTGRVRIGSKGGRPMLGRTDQSFAGRFPGISDAPLMLRITRDETKPGNWADRPRKVLIPDQ